MSDFLWVEKYRPKKISECILTEELKKTFTEFLKQKEIPNLLLSGSAGTGKTTVARALCEELGCDYIVINGSDEGRQIDTVRSKIKNFASTVSLSGGNHKVIIIDEADYISAESVQPALRGFIEEFSSNCRFIMTCNFKNRIINPLHSRCTVIDFKIPNSEKPKLASQFLARLMEICNAEGIQFNEAVLAELIMKFFPDFRRCLNEVQRYGIGGVIDTSGILFNLGEANTKELIKTLKEKRFNDMRKWVVQNLDKEPSTLFTGLYNILYTALEPKAVPQAVLIIAGYQYKAAFVADQEINMVACLTEIMIQ